MRYRAVVVEDEKPARDRIRRLLSETEDFVLVGEAADGPSAVKLLDEAKPDLCFLDVQIPEGDGFEVLGKATHRPHVIFTTAYDQYAIRAFEVHSLDYLLKPFTRERFSEALGRARRALADSTAPGGRILTLLEEIRSDLDALGRRRAEGSDPHGATAAPERIPARRGARILLLEPARILWFEAEDALVFAKTEEGRFLVERTLSELEAALGPSFFRAHRSFLVNLSLVGAILPGQAGRLRLLMRDRAASELPLSRRQAQRLRERLGW